MSKSRSRKAREDKQEWVVEPGTEVYGADGKKIGGVTDIQGKDLIVHKGGLFAKDYRIPFSMIADHTDERINLSVSADEASRAHDGEPADTPAAADRSVSGDEYGDTMAATAASTNEVADTTEVMRVPVVEEHLEASRHSVERGQVHVETNVSEHEETLDVPVTEERVRVQRVAVDRLATAADLALDSRSLDVAVYGEEIDLQTQSRVVEEVVISKDAVQESREVSGTVRREDIDVIDETVARDETATATVTSDEPSRL